MKYPTYKRILIFAFVLVSFFMCCIFIFLIKPYPGEDFAVYQRAGWNLSQGNGFSQEAGSPYFPLKWRMPLYPLFLALVYKLFGLNNNIVFIIQAIIFSAITVILFYITKELLNERIAYICAFLYAIYPIGPYWAGVLYPETLLTLLLILTVYFLIKYTIQLKLRYLVFGFFFSGLCILARPEFIYYPLFIILGFLILRFRVKDVFKIAAVGFLVLTFTIGPWVVRNYKVYGRFVPLIEGYQSGHLFYLATIEFRGNWSGVDCSKDSLLLKQKAEFAAKGYNVSEPFPFDLALEPGVNRIFYEYAFKNIKSEPFSYALSYLKRFLRLFVAVYNSVYNPLIIFVNIIVSSVILLFGLAGLWLLRKEVAGKIMLFLPFFYVILIHLPLKASSRYTVSVRPYLIVLASVALSAIWERISPMIEKRKQG